MNKIKQFFINTWNWIKRNTKKVLITVGIVGITTAAVISQPEQKPDIMIFDAPLYEQVRNWQKPTTDDGWAEDVKKESFNVKRDDQLDQMEQNLTEKLPKLQKDLDMFVLFPDYKKYELTERFSQMFKDAGNPNKLEGKTLQQWVDNEFQERLSQYTLDVEKIQQSLERIAKEKELRATKKVDRSKELLGTTYYADCVNGSTTGNGLSLTKGSTNAPFRYLDQFTEVARSAGDVVITRAATSTANSCGNGTDMGFTSDGTIVAPIVITRDYYNLWSDFASSTETYTPVFGSLYMNSSATPGAEMATNTWFYISGDDPLLYSYEIQKASSTGIMLFLPYKGQQSGSGKTLGNLDYNPVWGTAAGDFQWKFDTDENWKVQGIDIRGTDATGQVTLAQSYKTQFIDCIFIGNGAGDYGVFPINRTNLSINKSRFSSNNNFSVGCVSGSYQPVGTIILKNIFIANGGVGILFYTSGYDTSVNLELYDITMTGGTTGLKLGQFVYVKGRNVTLSGSTAKITMMLNYDNVVYLEDYNNIVGANQQNLGLTSVANDTPQVLSTSTIIRSGGGATSINVRPTTNFGTKWDFSKIQLFEYPIYADTTSKSYTVYFYATTTAAFTTDPTASELWIECEYWGNLTTDGSTNSRKLTKSTGVIDFNGTAGWQSLAVTCQPSQIGNLYLKGWYAKTKESGVNNIFFTDTTPVVANP